MIYHAKNLFPDVIMRLKDKGRNSINCIQQIILMKRSECLKRSDGHLQLIREIALISYQALKKLRKEAAINGSGNKVNQGAEGLQSPSDSFLLLLLAIKVS